VAHSAPSTRLAHSATHKDHTLTDFTTLGIAPRVIENLDAIGLKIPTPIQTQAIPQVLAGRDIMGLAQTGTGKTAAFGLPILTRLLEIGRRPNPKTARALILAPTRELATQIAENIQSFAKETPVRTFRVVGGASLSAQAERLSRGIDILVATPGRLIDLLDRRALSLSEVRYLVLDEADQMLDIGFIHALRQIARLLPAQRQTMLFSATMPKLMEELAQTYLTDPVKVQVSAPGKPVERIDQGVHFVNQGDKARLLADYMGKHPDELALVFGRTKHGSDKLAKLLESWGFSVGTIHGNKSQGQRERALSAFRSGTVKVLVATDVAARGIDIPDVRHVYNYEMPNVPENYVHRIGRTGRAGRDGRAVAFCSPGEVDELRAVEKAMKAAIPVIGGEVPAAAAPAPRRGGRPGHKDAHKAGHGGGHSGAHKAGGHGGQRPGQKTAQGAGAGGNRTVRRPKRVQAA
jgi:ATP-dependent RNA helicase RhlE